MDQNWMSDSLKEFSGILAEDGLTIEQCEQIAKRALSAAADALGIGYAEGEFTAPVTKLRPDGAARKSILYANAAPEGAEVYELRFTTADGGNVVERFFSRAGETFTEEEKLNLDYAGREIYRLFARYITWTMLRSVTFSDMDTGVGNMEALMRHVGMLLQRGIVGNFSVLFFNIHNFKYVNKVLSYSEGDKILRLYAQTLQARLGENEMIARLGGDNFIAIVKAETTQETIESLQNFKLTAMTEKGEKTFLFGATIGYSSLVGIHSPRDIMLRSSLAYQAARGRRANSAVEYTEEIQRGIMERQAILSNFIPALEAGDFVVYYQPQVDMANKKVCGAEALVRWIRNGQLIPPIQFIPLLEQEGSIVQLDYYVLEKVCQFLKKRQEAGQEMLCISVNFSRRHLEEENLVENIVNTIDKYGIDHNYIEIELTESEDYQNYEKITEIVEHLKNNGIGTAMDDFGTGFSSLNMIKQVDLSVIKLDKSFIPLEEEYPGKARDMIMFYGLVKLIRNMGKKTIAEGVETSAQLGYLREAGCSIVQGYIFDKPLPEAEFEERLETGY